MLPRIWAEEVITHHGTYYQIPGGPLPNPYNDRTPRSGPPVAATRRRG